jgi:hypothetical protein
MAHRVKQRQKAMTNTARRSDQKYLHGRFSWISVWTGRCRTLLIVDG